MKHRLLGGSAVVLLLTLVGLRVAQSRGPEPAAAAPVTREQPPRQFRAGVLPVSRLEGGAPSRDSLVRSFVTALEEQDSAALGNLVMTKAEFAWLYYPTTPQALPPYELDAETLWMMIGLRSNRDIGLALHELGGRPLGYQSHRCADEPRLEGENRVWGFCSLERRVDGISVTERLFGLIIERDGVFKFVSYANRLH